MEFGQNNMKILIITSSHPYKASGVVALDLYNSLKTINGYDVKLITKPYEKFTNPDFVSYESKIDYYISKVQRKFVALFKKIKLYKPLLTKTNRDYAIQEYDQTKTPIATKKILQKVGIAPDVIVVLFNVKFLSYKNFYELGLHCNVPILIKMADMAPMTGGCHYTWACKGYMNNCGFCPAYKSTIEYDQSRKNFKFKKQFIQRTNIVPIAGSEQQYQQLLSSTLFRNKPKYKVINSIDPDRYKPGNREESRKKLGLPLDKKIIFFGAISYNVPRKGFKELFNALEILSHDIDNELTTNILLVVAGNRLQFIDKIKLTTKAIGYLNHDELIHAYRAADIYLSPSIEDSGPMMVRQAAMTGTPIVAFNIGNAMDFVVTGQTGYRARLYDVKDYAQGIKFILDLSDVDYKKMCEDCRTIALKLASPQAQAAKYENIFSDLLNRNVQ